jgi:PAS domain S-box-containing protein
MNPALATMLGYDNPAEAMDAITDIANDIYVEPQVRNETITRALAAGDVISAEHLYWGRGGSTWVGHLRLRATTDPDGNFRYLEGWIDDITEQKEIEKVRAEKENELRAIVDASPFPMIITKFPDGNIMFANTAFSELVGIQIVECFNRLTIDFYEDLSEREAIIYQIKNSGRIINKEFGLRKSGGHAVWCMMSAVTFRFNNYDALLICLNDISARKQLEHSLQLANLQAGKALQAERTANQEQRNFLAMVSHEFRMPLAIIQAASRIVSLYTHEPDAQDECEKIIRAVRKMTDLIEVCLSDARLDTPTVMQNVTKINLYGFVNELIQNKISCFTNTLVVHGDQTVHTNCDKALLEIALSNLIDNAIKYSPKDVPVDLTVGFDAGDAVVRIQDHGVGMSTEDAKRIFEKFFRSTKTDNVQGVGLGLFIVNRIIELHGGSIKVESELGVGTTFIVSLPAISTPPS